MTETKPLWGHDLLTPEGIEMRLPAFALSSLRQLGLTAWNGKSGMWQLLPRIDAFLDPECDSLMMGLRRLLGKELEGPEWLICKCRACNQLKEDMDKTMLPRHMIRENGQTVKRPWLKVIRAPRHPVAVQCN